MTTPTNRTSLRNRLVAVSAATVLGAGALAVPAFAQDADTDTGTDHVETDDERPSREDREARRAERRAAFRAAIADELGIDVEAFEAAAEQAKADLEDTAFDSREERREAFGEALAAELGVTTDDLDAARDAVKEAARAERLTSLAERLDDKVAEGEISREEADEILARAEAGELPGRRGHRGHRGLHGPRGADGAATSDA